MKIEPDQIRGYRLNAHHLDKKLPACCLTRAAGACGLQNSPPGAWETAMFNRIEGCTLSLLNDALYKEKSLLQAWSFRGAPVVFPTNQSAIFLSPLSAKEGEKPWIYTQGITSALDFVQISFDDLLLRTKEAVRYLDYHTVKSKESLDQILADIILDHLPEEKREPWCAPSMYGSPDRQTVGGAAVSFLLRPCSFSSLVVFGERQGISPTFTSYTNWTGRLQEPVSDAGRKLVRKFLHCYGPSTQDSFMGWLGCSRPQAHRLWNTVKDEIEPVSFQGRVCYMLSSDMEALLTSPKKQDRLLLLGAHDPYLDIKDRAILLDNPALQKVVWKTVANPGVILRGGRIAGIWKTKIMKDQMELALDLFKPLSPSEQVKLRMLAGEYAAFRLKKLKTCTFVLTT